MQINRILRNLAKHMEYEHINLNDYTRTGEGGTAVSYTHRAREEFLTA